MTKGTVYSSNPLKHLIALATGRNEFTIIQASLTDFGIGDQVEWDEETALGAATYRNLTKGSSISVVVKNHWVPVKQLKHQLLMPR